MSTITKVIRREACIFGDPNCTTEYMDDGTKRCVMRKPQVTIYTPITKEPEKPLRGWQKKYNNPNICPCHGMTNCQFMD